MKKFSIIDGLVVGEGVWFSDGTVALRTLACVKNSKRIPPRTREFKTLDKFANHVEAAFPLAHVEWEGGQP